MYKILLVDDEILVREAIRDKLKWNELGFELVGDCENGKEAVAIIEKEEVDLVLTDICMPYMDGLELSKYLYESHQDIAIVIFSGYSDFEYAKKAIKYKVSEYILKPVTAMELSEVLTKVKGQLDEKKQEERRLTKLNKAYHNYTKNEGLITAKILTRLIKGTQSLEVSLDELHEMNVRIKGKGFRVAAVDIDIYSDLYHISEELKKESALMAFVVENIAAEILEKEDAGLAFQDTDNRTYLLFNTNKIKEFRAQVITLCEEVQKRVKENTGLSISIGVGEYVEFLAELPKSYESAMELLKRKFSQGEGQIYDAEELKEPLNTEPLKEYMEEIKKDIARSDKKAIEGILDKLQVFFQKNLAKREEIITYLHQILSMIYEGARGIDDTITLSDADIAAIMEMRTLEQSIDFIKEHTDKIFAHTTSLGQPTKEIQTELAMDYLEKNFGNPDLTLQHICTFLGMSTSHFSSIIKETTGKTFTELLTAVRMERAKKLLLETTYKNYEIAEKVGYSDPHYFNIAFKKTTGMTPKRYKGEYS